MSAEKSHQYGAKIDDTGHTGALGALQTIQNLQKRNKALYHVLDKPKQKRLSN